jgi:hypothetical protein
MCSAVADPCEVAGNDCTAYCYVAWLLIGLSFAATIYAAVAAVAMPLFGKRIRCRLGNWAAVSVLKPLCGIEPRLYENLADGLRAGPPLLSVAIWRVFAH